MARRLRLLVIDDNPDDRLLVVRALGKDFTLDAVEVSDPAGLKKAFAHPRFDLAVIDYKLNWSTGLKIFPMLRRRFPKCPVIMFTATGSEEIAVEAMKLGLDDYVLKSPRHFANLRAAATRVMKRSRTQARNRLLEERLQNLLGSLDVGVYRLSQRGKPLYANPAFRKLFGFKSRRDMQGWDLHALADPAEAAAIAEQLKRAGHVHLSELRLRIPGGRELWVSLSQVVRAGGVVEGLIGDVTERKRLAASLRDKEEELHRAQRLESVGRLAGGVAHDFNNLLTAINGYSELLMEMAGDDHPFQDKLAEIRKAGGRAAAVTRQLLAFSRRQMLRPKLLDVNALIMSMEMDIRLGLGNGIRVNLSLGEALGNVFADPSQIENALMNLVSNAREAMPEGGRLYIGTRNIDVTEGGVTEAEMLAAASLRTGSYTVVEVGDTGPGMNAETRARLFEPFFTTKTAGKGMGLCTTYGIIKQSGGEIFVDSLPGRGSRFFIFLPRIPSPVEDFPRNDRTALVTL
jgi:two-component system cell cycle sensor histidine kinase/response regulator CckA